MRILTGVEGCSLASKPASLRGCAHRCVAVERLRIGTNRSLSFETQSHSRRIPHHIGSVMGSDLSHEPFAVVVDRAHGDSEKIGDFLGRHSIDDGGEDFALPRSRGFFRVRCGGAILLFHFRAEEEASGLGRFDRADQFAGSVLLRDAS